MSTSLKGLNEMHRLHAHVSTTVYDRSWKGTTEQFVLHFHEQIRQLDELIPQKEQLPHSVRLNLLQTAVRSVPEIRIVETMEEYMSLTNCSSGHFSITYGKYFMMLQNASIRYDKTLKQKPSTTSRAVYQHELKDDHSIHKEEDDYLDANFAPDGIDTSSDDIYDIHNSTSIDLHVNHSSPEHHLENQNPGRLYLQNLDIMDLYISPIIFTTCLVKTPRRS